MRSKKNHAWAEAQARSKAGFAHTIERYKSRIDASERYAARIETELAAVMGQVETLQDKSYVHLDACKRLYGVLTKGTARLLEEAPEPQAVLRKAGAVLSIGHTGFLLSDFLNLGDSMNAQIEAYSSALAMSRELIAELRSIIEEFETRAMSPKSRSAAMAEVRTLYEFFGKSSVNLKKCAMGFCGSANTVFEDMPQRLDGIGKTLAMIKDQLPASAHKAAADTRYH